MPDLSKRDVGISIHALLAESDRKKSCSIPAVAYFYPRSPCGERRVKSFMRNGFFLISIHALLAESDPRACRAWSRRPYFYPRSPCGERLFVPAHVAVVPSISIHALLAESDGAGREFNVAVLKFLSTLSLRRATSRAPPTVDPLAHFYPRSPCGERPKRIHCA